MLRMHSSDTWIAYKVRDIQSEKMRDTIDLHNSHKAGIMHLRT